jgi:cytochrome c oxidase subunit 3
MTMMFAGLTSAFVVSKSRADWLKDFQLPTAFFYSTVAIIGCSVTFYLAKKAIQKQSKKTTLFLSTLVLGILFVVLQFVGFGQIVDNGYYFTGSGSSITTYFVTVVTLIHLAGGVISLLIIIYNHFKQKIQSSQTLELNLVQCTGTFLTYYGFICFCFIFL